MRDKAAGTVRGLTKVELGPRILGFVLKDQHFDYYHRSSVFTLYIYIF